MASMIHKNNRTVLLAQIAPLLDSHVDFIEMRVGHLILDGGDYVMKNLDRHACQLPTGLHHCVAIQRTQDGEVRKDLDGSIAFYFTLAGVNAPEGVEVVKGQPLEKRHAEYISINQLCTTGDDDDAVNLIQWLSAWSAK